MKRYAHKRIGCSKRTYEDSTLTVALRVLIWTLEGFESLIWTVLWTLLCKSDFSGAHRLQSKHYINTLLAD